MLRKFTYVLLLILLASQVKAQFWKLYTKEDGLPSKQINDLIIAGTNQIWIATDSGLVFFNGINFTTYSSQNSGLANNHLKEIEFINGDLYMITDSGLSHFDGRNFNNFNAQNGLLNNRINSMAQDTNGLLWLASNAGVSRYNGSSFTHDTGRVAKDIVVDDSNRVYILKYSVVFNIPSAGLTIYEMFDGQSWSSPPMNFFPDYYRSQFYKSPNGKILLMPTGGGKQFYAELSYPFNLTKKSIITGGSVNRTPHLMKELNGERWMVYWGVSSLYRSLAKDSSYQALYLLPSGVEVNEIDADSFITVMATDEGFLIGPAQYDIPHFSEHLDVNEIKAGMHIQGALFQNYAEGKPYFEYPADSNSFLIWAANFQLGFKRDSTDGNYNIYPEEIYNQPFEGGPYHRSNQLVGDKYLTKINKSDIDFHRLNYSQASYTAHESILNWPAISDSAITSHPELAPFFDANNNGCYDPMQGDYPIIKGDQAIYWINHPKDKSIALEYHWMLYAYDSPNDTALNRSIFVELRLINRDTAAFNYIKAGFRVDADLGSPSDDFNGSDSTRDLMYFYNGDPFDENYRGLNGYGLNPPALGIRTLSSPSTSTTFYQTAISGFYSGIWNYLHGMNGDSSYFINLFTNKTTRHQYSGDPYLFQGWTESNLDPTKAAANRPGDRKGTIGFPSFSLQPGEDHTMELVINVAQGSSRTANAEYLPLLKSQVDYVEGIYKNQLPVTKTYSLNFNCPLTVEIIEQEKRESSHFNLYPNPSSGLLNIRSSKTIELIQILDLNGKVISESIPSKSEIMMDFRDEATNGIYIIRLMHDEGWHQEKVIFHQ